MKNIRRKSKRNPWRNTRNDFVIPWNDIGAAIFMAILPIMIILIAGNVVVRSETFYSYYVSKTEVVKEIPYEIENQDVSETFGKFMMHKTSEFQLKENSEYMPQQVFNERDAKVMHSIRTIADVLLIVGIVLFVACFAIGFYLCRQGEKKILYESFINSWVWFAVLLLANGVIYFVPAVRELIFKEMYGVRFPPGDVLIQIFETKLPTYFGVALILASIVLAAAVFYVMNKFVKKQKMFKA